ncbi:MAG TPA: hypothetical protein VHB21_23895 [Minicystis sp.]|nr:hypothetical protein [Minicystis sp.]
MRAGVADAPAAGSARGTPEASASAAPGVAPEEAPVRELVESDEAETRIPYDASARVPKLLAVFWVTALAGLVVYAVVYLFPDLLRWGKP